MLASLRQNQVWTNLSSVAPKFGSQKASEHPAPKLRQMKVQREATNATRACDARTLGWLDVFYSVLFFVELSVGQIWGSLTQRQLNVYIVVRTLRFPITQPCLHQINVVCFPKGGVCSVADGASQLVHVQSASTDLTLTKSSVLHFTR